MPKRAESMGMGEAPREAARVFQMWEIDNKKIMSDGRIIDVPQAEIDERRKEWKDDQERLKKEMSPKELAAYEEDRREDEERETYMNEEFKKRFPIGSKIEISSGLFRRGKTENLEKIKILGDKLEAIFKAEKKIHQKFHKLMDKRDGDEWKKCEEEYHKLSEQRYPLEKEMEELVWASEFAGNDSVGISDKVMEMIKKNMSGTVVAADAHETARPGDSFEEELIVKVGNDLLRFGARCDEYGMGVVYTLETLQEAVDERNRSYAK